MFQTVVFGYAVNTDVRHVKTAVYDLDNSPESRDLTARFAGSGYFGLWNMSTRTSGWQELIDTGHSQGGAADEQGLRRGTARAGGSHRCR